jgi:hypothetical protein
MKALRYALRLNAASCLIFGLGFAVGGGTVARFLGDAPPLLLRGIGALLLFNGAHLWLASLRTRVLDWEVLWFSVGDIAWFVGTLGLLAGGLFVTTGPGRLAAWGVGFAVLGMGMAQLWLLAEATGSGRADGATPKREPAELIPGHFTRLGAIGASWMAMKLWVKLWLFALNGVFLAALLFWPEPAAKLTLAAYLAAGPLLFAYMVMQRGLTRLLGVAHLAPWIPLVLYLALRLTGDAAGPRIAPAEAPALFAYLIVLIATVAVCLAFDVVDVARWFRGERYRLGAPSALAAGASGAVPVSGQSGRA